MKPNVSPWNHSRRLMRREVPGLRRERRPCILLAGLCLWLGSAQAGFAAAASARGDQGAPPFLITTDLYRPHADPDDHFDLACLFALAHRGDIALKGVVIDYPAATFHADRDPDIAAVAQMNTLTGLAVPVAVGTSVTIAEAARGAAPLAAGTRLILEVLRSSSRPVALQIVGSARDVAVAGLIDPGLFARKCAAVYLNAGQSAREVGNDAPLPECNRHYDPDAYAAIFGLPCPVYWLPCFDRRHYDAEGRRLPMAVGEYCSVWTFRQSEILPALSPRVKNYLAFMFARAPATTWLQYLNGPSDAALLEREERATRGMWSTAGFFDAAGYGVTREGRLVPKGTPGAAFAFEPIRVHCGDGADATWGPAPGGSDRYIIQVRDIAGYPHAMTEAMKTLLLTLP